MAIFARPPAGDEKPGRGGYGGAKVQADAVPDMDLRVLGYGCDAALALGTQAQLVVIVVFLDRRAARLSHLLADESPADLADDPPPIAGKKAGKKAAQKKSRRRREVHEAPHGTYGGLMVREIHTGRVALPGLPEAASALTCRYFWTVLEDCLPPLDEIGPAQAKLLPFYPLLLHRLRDDELREQAEKMTVTVRETVKTLPLETRWQVVNSNVDVFRRWKPDLEDLVGSLLMSAFKLEEKDTMTFRHGKAEGKAEGRAEGKAEEARRLLLLVGRKRCGEPDADMIATIDATTDVAQLEAWIANAALATTWAEIFA